jgi:hypothetical protein
MNTSHGWHILKLFVNSGRIQQQKNNKFRVITITKWEDYQCLKNVQQQNVNNSSSHTRMSKNEKNLSQREDVSFKDDFNDDNRVCQRSDLTGHRTQAEGV